MCKCTHFAGGCLLVATQQQLLGFADISGRLLAGCTYAGEDGSQHSQGCLQVLLMDIQLQRQLLVATTHLKAKAGADNEAMRVSQVRGPTPTVLPQGTGSGSHFELQPII